LAQEDDYPPASDMALKQRMLIFSDRVLEVNEQMRRYALDLPALAAVSGGGRPADLAARARPIFLAHVAALEKCVEKLEEDLRRAMPRPGKGSGRPRGATLLPRAASPEAAGQLALAAQRVSRRVYRFIYPDEHTVGLEDLQNPSLLEALLDLGGMAEALRRGGGEARGRPSEGPDPRPQ
jgi:hypothetical protein